ncbi:MAG: MYXO-CTERM sorting domain-containing protein [Minicystis sp.]
MLSRAFAAAAGLSILTLSGSASAIPRSEVMARAKSFAYHPWSAATPNLTASCAAAYTSVYVPGDYVGLPYDWGGYMSLFEFDQGLSQGLGAGSYPEDGVLSCTVGLDCSGFVSKCWDTGHYTTSSIPQISSAIDAASLLPGDAFNDAGYHVALYSHTLGNGEPVFYEAIGYNVHLNATEGWSHVDGYIPRRYTGITGTTAPDPLGTPVNPIIIPSLPYTDSRDTTQSSSDILDGCAAAASKPETGREFVYQVTLNKPGKLTATVADDAGVDIDIHLYTSMNTSDCVARNDTTITMNVDCGTYYLVADTFKGAMEYPGPYTLTVDFVPSATPCGNGPPAYAPSGELGDPCGYPGDESLPFCNPNLGADTCLYTSTTSFCSKPCTSNADCTALPGGCCGDIGGGETYCFTAPNCGSSNPPDPQGQPDAGGDPPIDGGAMGSGSTSASSSTSGGGGSGNGTGGNMAAVGGGGAGGESDGSGGKQESGGGCGTSGGAPGGVGGAVMMAAVIAAMRRRRRN